MHARSATHVGFCCSLESTGGDECLRAGRLPGTPVTNPLDLFSQNGVLSLDLLMQNSIDVEGFPHYCYIYMYQGQRVEAPTLRLNPGETLMINFTNNLQDLDPARKAKKKT